MKTSHKFLLIIGYIFSFGILYLVLNNLAKKQAQKQNNNLIVSKNIPFDVNQFINTLGGINNITQTTSTLSSIRIKLKNTKLIEETNLKQFKPKGYMWNADNVLTILFGDFATTLSEIINQQI